MNDFQREDTIALCGSASTAYSRSFPQFIYSLQMLFRGREFKAQAIA